MKKTAKSVVKSSQKDDRPRIHNWAGIIYTIVSAGVIIVGTYIAVRWAQGDFRTDQNTNSLASETGLLHATSVPQGAQVYIDGKLTSATDDIIYLAPGSYNVVIQKDGYSPWQKQITIEKALVSQTNATLFPYSPSLTSLTFTGITDPLVSPDGSKILFNTATASAKSKNGLYVLDLGNSQKSARQITDLDPDYPFTDALFAWSPDSNEILVVTDDKIFLLNAHNFVNLQSATDVSFQLPTIFDSWEEEIAKREQLYAEKIPQTALDVILTNGENFFLSPDQTKILYTATAAAAIPNDLIAALPASNSQPETRTIEAGKVYIYDSYEDRNYQIDTADLTTLSTKKLLTQPITNSNLITNIDPIIINSLQTDDTAATIANFSNYYGNQETQLWQWLPDSTHLVGVVNGQIVIITYDGSNATAIYSGPLAENNFVVPYTDSDRILISTKFNPESPDNIYAIELVK